MIISQEQNNIPHVIGTTELSTLMLALAYLGERATKSCQHEKIVYDIF